MTNFQKIMNRKIDMDKNYISELRELDCNCNDCKHLTRDFGKLNKHRKSYEGTGLSDNLQFGFCKKFENKPICFSPNTCQLETQECFEYRK